MAWESGSWRPLLLKKTETYNRDMSTKSGGPGEDILAKHENIIHFRGNNNRAIPTHCTHKRFEAVGYETYSLVVCHSLAMLYNYHGYTRNDTAPSAAASSSPS